MFFNQVTSLEEFTNEATQIPGATRVNPVTLQLGEGRQFMSPGYDGISSYSPESKCLWTFAPAPGTALKFTCSKFSVTPMDPVGERCRGESQTCRKQNELDCFR